eukprot:6963956-Prymnesium_polylepis.1
MGRDRARHQQTPRCTARQRRSAERRPSCMAPARGEDSTVCRPARGSSCRLLMPPLSWPPQCERRRTAAVAEAWEVPEAAGAVPEMAPAMETAVAMAKDAKSRAPPWPCCPCQLSGSEYAAAQRYEQQLSGRRSCFPRQTDPWACCALQRSESECVAAHQQQQLYCARCWPRQTDPWARCDLQRSEGECAVVRRQQ